MGVVSDVVGGTVDGLCLARGKLLRAYVQVPIGIGLLLLILYGVDRALALTPVTVPASIMCMLVVFLGLQAMESTLGSARVSSVLAVLNIPAQFALVWINICFTPSFILLPLAERVSVAEAFEIAGVFVVGFVVVFAVSVYMSLGLQALLGGRRRAEFAETASPGSSVLESPSLNETIETPIETPISQASSLPLLPLPLANVDRPHHPSVPLQTVHPDSTEFPAQVSASYSRTVVRAHVLHFVDWYVYGLLFVAGLVVYAVTGYLMPLQLSIVVLTYLWCLVQIPTALRLYLHPIVVCGALSIFGIYLTALIRSQTLLSALQPFKTGKNYLRLFDPAYSGVLPGAGDVLSSLLDVSIVSLATTLYSYRAELRRHFVILTVPSLALGIASFFAYPPLCTALNIAPARALAFMVRSVTLALALPIVQAVQGSQTLASVVAILSGIFGVLLGPFLLKVLGVRPDDYLTRGISLGINSSAVASANLLKSDPRAAAMSTLSFFLFGVSMVVLSAIPACVRTVQSLVHLKV